MKLFQITEEDLGELERILPRISDDLMCSLQTRHKVQLRRVQTILSHVRWNYGPPLRAKTIPAGPEAEPSGGDEVHSSGID